MSTRHLDLPMEQTRLAPAAVARTDPIFSAIELYRPAYVAYGAAAKRADKVAAKQEGRRVTPDDEAALTSAERELERREAELIAAGPTTVEGTRAVAEIVGKEGLTKLQTPKQIAQWLLGLPILNPPSTSAPDEALGGRAPIQSEGLAAALDAALAAARNPADYMDDEVLYNRPTAIINEILKTPVGSLDDIMVRARAVHWCHSDEPADFESETLDLRLAEQIVNGLLALDHARPQ